MFSMLRHERVGGGSFIVEPTCAPFDKRRQSSMVRLACIRCRSKKVKCTGEKDGCRRCKENNTSCSYSSSGSSHSSSSKGHREPSTRSEPSPPRQLTSTSSPEIFDPSLTPTSIEDKAGGWSSDQPNDHLDQSLMDVNANMFESLTPDETLLGGTPFQSLFSDSVDDFSFLAGVDPSCSSPLPLVLSNDQHEASSVSYQKCSCSEIVRAYETAEVYLVWAPGDRSGATSIKVDEVLGCQKMVLATCEAVLDCESCHLQSENAMLMISICDKLLASFTQMSPILASEDSAHSESSAPPSPTRDRHQANKRRKHSLDFKVSDWKFDDEDKTQVLRVLISSRAVKLNSIIDRLEEVATKRHWLVHRNMIRSLVERLDEHQTLWKG